MPKIHISRSSIRIGSVMRTAIVALCAIFCLFITDCRSRRSAERTQHITISFFGWGPSSLVEVRAAEELLARFSAESGIQAKYIIAPESVEERLALAQHWLEQKSETPDVLYVDSTWPGILANDLVDLNPYFEEEAKGFWPAAVQDDKSSDKLIAMPFNLEFGVLYYRNDLLMKYGYGHPPRTWEELGVMAAKIQKGERSAGNKDFWGFVWQGAAYEGLTCNALEWQVSYGGGNIIEKNGIVSVNNPRTIAAIKMARSWIGTISPPSVLTFMEGDSRSIWNQGNAAFARDWIWRGTERGSAITPETASMTLIPGEGERQASVLGGQSLAISKYSRHPREAAQLIRYLTSQKVQLQLSKDEALLPAARVFYDDPLYSHNHPELEQLKSILTTGGVERPSTISGKHYPEVSRAYYMAVHSALSGDASVEHAMANLQTELVRITGFKPAEPHVLSETRTVP